MFNKRKLRLKCSSSTQNRNHRYYPEEAPLKGFLKSFGSHVASHDSGSKIKPCQVNRHKPTSQLFSSALSGGLSAGPAQITYWLKLIDSSGAASSLSCDLDWFGCYILIELFV